MSVSSERSLTMPILFAKLVKALQEEPRTYLELVDITGLSRQSIYRYIKVFRDFDLIHVGDWDEDKVGRRRVRAWAWGDKPDVPMPAVKPKPQASRDYRERLKVKASSIFALGERAAQR
jgi:hypothetical protein